MNIIFVCTGNICRSPTAEGVAISKAKIMGISNKFSFSSAGISSFHIGQHPDPKTVQTASKYGVSMASLKAKQITIEDLENNDLILGMDHSHCSFLKNMSPTPRICDKIHLFLKYLQQPNNWGDEVIDPYYRSQSHFDQVYKIIDQALEKFFSRFLLTTN